jgi:DNA-binding transcriptional LysR family regulator
MDKLRALETFVAIADTGSLTAAARARGSSLPAVVRLLSALEADLGARLFQRTTRRVALTDAGRRYLERSRELLSLLADADAELHADGTEPRGKLSVTAPVWFGQRHVASGVAAFVQRHAGVNVDILLFDRVVNLVEEGIDVAVRIGALDDSSLFAQSVGSMRRVTVAAPAYLAQRGSPERPEQLAGHNCVRIWRPGSAAWEFREAGKAFSVPVQGNLSVNQVSAAVDACVAGLGVGTFFAYQVAPFVASGALRVILASFETPPRPIHIVYPQARLLPARTRAFIEFMKRHILAEEVGWQLAEARPARGPRPERSARAAGKSARRGQGRPSPRAR